VIAILAVLFVTALIAAPNAGDALSYHVARVEHWAQNRSVDFYPTHIERQLWSNPWSEYVILHLRLISGGDRFTNVVQWAALAGCSWLSFAIARLLGGSLAGASFAALFTATIPMAVAQAAGAQNDLVAGFWLLALVTLSLKGMDNRPRSLALSAAVGASLGLAILTKGTNYIFAFPFVVWWLLGLRHTNARRAVAHFALLASTALLLNATHYYRNAALYGWPLGPKGGGGVVNALHSPSAITSNLIRNAALHVGTPDDTRLPFSHTFNEFANRAVTGVHRFLRISVDDPRTTWEGAKFAVPMRARNELLSGNPLHLSLIVVALFTILLLRRRRSALVSRYGLALAAQVLLFAAAFKWHPAASRLHLPFFLAAAPFAAVVFAGLWRKQLVLVISAVLAARAVPMLLHNSARPLTGPGSIFQTPRAKQYFTVFPWAYDSYSGAVDFIARTRCRRIGLRTGPTELEYGFWALARTRMSGLTIRHIDVDNPSGSLAMDDPVSVTPCVVVALHEDDVNRDEKIPVLNALWSRGRVSVHSP
jgi:hypothetical protein